MKKFLPFFIIVFSVCYSVTAADSLKDGYVTTGNVDDLKVSIYPNPLINNEINIESNFEFYGVEILDIVGKSVISEDYSTPLSKKTIRLDGLDKGLYLIRIKFGNKKVYTEKIIIK